MGNGSLTSVSIYLKNQGYTVHGAANGAEGLAAARAQPIHLAIVDVMMPVMDGITLVMKQYQIDQYHGWIDSMLCFSIGLYCS